MNTPDSSQSSPNAAAPGVAYERCLCREVVDALRARLGVSPAVKQHLANSRIEFLKAVREVINQRIEHLSQAGSQGSKIQVE
jgi:hypothetical protein